METTPTVDVTELEARVKDMYRDVAEEPGGDYHFELGRSLAEHLGYPTGVLDQIPGRSIESFAGVGYFFDLAQLAEGETVVDLGSGSGMDAFVAAATVGNTGRVIGIDFTAPQLEKARRLGEEGGFAQVEFRAGRIEDLGLDDASVDCVISNGVINLAPDKGKVFAEAARVLRPGGRLAIADIVSEAQLKESIVCNAELWAACIGGAAQEDAYRQAIEGAGLEIEEVKENPYRFISERAQDASDKYGVKSVSIRARKT
jgi:ubiquinone/menaquinone biosynthesis C-methylase UbiE